MSNTFRDLTQTEICPVCSDLDFRRIGGFPGHLPIHALRSQAQAGCRGCRVLIFAIEPHIGNTSSVEIDKISDGDKFTLLLITDTGFIGVYIGLFKLRTETHGSFVTVL